MGLGITLLLDQLDDELLLDELLLELLLVLMLLADDGLLSDDGLLLSLDRLLDELSLLTDETLLLSLLRLDGLDDVLLRLDADDADEALLALLTSSGLPAAGNGCHSHTIRPPV